jgi:F0F1-type ATP synthase assembly protein I
MIAARLVSLLVVGGIIAWLIGRAVAALEAPGGGWLSAAPWFVLIFAVAIGYAFAFDRFARRKR